MVLPLILLIFAEKYLERKWNMMKKTVTGLAMLGLVAVASFAQNRVQTGKSSFDSKTHVARLEKFVDKVSALDTLSKAHKDSITSVYKFFLAEHKAVHDSLTDEEVRQCSKQKVRYQKAMARIYVRNASDGVQDTAEGVGKSVSKFFKKTGKKIQGAIDGFKEN